MNEPSVDSPQECAELRSGVARQIDGRFYILEKGLENPRASAQDTRVYLRRALASAHNVGISWLTLKRVFCTLIIRRSSSPGVELRSRRIGIEHSAVVMAERWPLVATMIVG